MGDPIGVAKLAVEIIREKRNGSGFTPKTCAVCIAIGKKIAAAAVLEINSLITHTVKQITINAT